MEAATAPEVAAGSKLKVKEASPADAEPPQASPGQGAGSPTPQLLPPIEEHPKIWLPRTLRQTYIRKVGDTVNLLIPFQGKPKPQAIWTHDGCALDTRRVSVRNGERDSILFIREAQRADSGRYQLRVQLGGLEATATIDILVIERPGPPQSIKLVDVWGFSATLEWTPPQDTGNTALLGYTVQKADTKSGVRPAGKEGGWKRACWDRPLVAPHGVADFWHHVRPRSCGSRCWSTITAPAASSLTSSSATPMPSESLLKTSADSVKQPPSPQTSPTSRKQPKIIWLKNKMDIQGNPKYRALTHLGICSLEIRKPGPFDGGIYTCKAVNPLGEASVDCRVDVKGKGKRRTSALGCQSPPLSTGGRVREQRRKPRWR
uniref:Myosin binding protein H like n=1 Tax=Gorilla gorilla gorilla TaxID=9595 RepID=A0A2I2YHZ2_GORGO